jgi:predicted XRE-type DNA-binding protein
MARPAAAGVPRKARAAGMTTMQLERTFEQDTDDLTRTEKLRIAARVLIRRGVAGTGRRWGLQSRLAEHFGVTRQRVSQIVRQELAALNADPR